MESEGAVALVSRAVALAHVEQAHPRVPGTRTRNEIEESVFVRTPSGGLAKRKQKVT